LARTVKRLATASAVFAISFQTEHGIAQVFVSQLPREGLAGQYRRAEDPANGAFATGLR
jgi:hypothetical protein